MIALFLVFLAICNGASAMVQEDADFKGDVNEKLMRREAALKNPTDFLQVSSWSSAKKMISEHDNFEMPRLLTKRSAEVDAGEELPGTFERLASNDEIAQNMRRAVGCLTVGDIGAACTYSGQDICKIGLQCNGVPPAAGKCVAPAKTGASCNWADSAFMCENSNYCKCTDTTQASCTCKAETKTGGSCTKSYECANNGGCISGKCVAPGSVAAGGATISFIYCKAGLLLSVDISGTTPVYTCQNPSSVSCVTAANCADAGPYDAVFMSCTAGKCQYNGPDCNGKISDLLNVYKKLDTNVIDASNNKFYSSLADKSCSLDQCMYSKNTDGKFNCDSFREQQYLHSSAQTTFTSVGGACGTAAPTARCKVNDYCDYTKGTCQKLPAAGAACGRGSTDFTYDVCDFDLYCTEFAFASTDTGSLGKCAKPAKNKATCSSTSGTLSGGTQTYYSQVACQDGSDCDFTDPSCTTTVCTRNGKCQPIGYITKAGTATSSPEFCAFPLAFKAGASMNGLGTCEDLTALVCVDNGDCSGSLAVDGELGGSVGGGIDYDAGGGSFGWDYNVYLDAKVCCTGGKCGMANSKQTCQKQYTSGASQSPTEVCPFEKCLLSDDTNKGFLLCVNHATSFTPSVFVLAIISAIAMAMLF